MGGPAVTLTKPQERELETGNWNVVARAHYFPSLLICRGEGTKNEGRYSVNDLLAALRPRADFPTMTESGWSLMGTAFGGYKRNIVVLFMSAELLNIMNNRRKQGLW